MQKTLTTKAVSVSLLLTVIACSTTESSTGAAIGGQAGGGASGLGDVGGGGTTSASSSSAAQGGTSHVATGTSSAGATHPGDQTTGGVATSAHSTGGTSNSIGGSGTTSVATGGKAAGGSATGGQRTSASSGGVPVGSGGTGFGGSATSTTSLGGAASGGRASGGAASGGAPAGGQGSGGSNATGGNGLLVPASGALLGLFTPAQSESELSAAETQIGRKVAIHLGYFDWPDNFASFAQTDIAAGRIPYVTVEPWKVTLDAIASGTEDTTIRSRASALSGLKGKVLLRFAHEMNGNWYPWDGYHNGANTSAPQKYIAAYRHIHDLFASSGVTNVLWVFCPNVDSVPSDSWNQWSNYYPGDSYVDWMGFDGYNWGTDTFASIASRIYPGLSAKNKPIMLGETSTQDVEKSNWISAIVPAMKSQFPQLKALVWFDVNKEQDWRYDSSSSSLSAFITMAKDPYFNP